jgi:cell division protein FtsW (lipid II flippase)
VSSFFLEVFVYNTTDAGNIAVWCLILFGVLFMAGLPVGGMMLALVGVIFVSCMLHK